jgi:biotin transport system substrate-specific component
MTALTTSVAHGRRLVLADLIPGTRVRDAVLVIAGAGLTGLAAQVSIRTSLSPVPFTLQTLAVLTIGGMLGSVRGAASMLLYLLAGIAGVPWYAGHGHGWGSASFGYVLGFVAAAALTGALAERGQDRHPVSTLGMLAMGSAVIYITGTCWIAADLHVSAARAISLGVTPFLITDALKIACASIVLPAVWRISRATSATRRADTGVRP